MNMGKTFWMDSAFFFTDHIPYISINNILTTDNGMIIICSELLLYIKLSHRFAIKSINNILTTNICKLQSAYKVNKVYNILYFIISCLKCRLFI